jgi:hypothetical protein
MWLATRSLADLDLTVRETKRVDVDLTVAAQATFASAIAPIPIITAAQAGVPKALRFSSKSGTPPLSTTSSGASDQVVAPNSAGCAYASGWNSNWQTLTDFRGIPTLDIFGSNLINNSYWAVTTNAAGYVDINNHSNGIPIATNAADDAARRIRIGTTDPAYGRGLNGVIINSIGLGNAAVPLPADGIFLERVSNDTRSPIYDSNYPAGLYVYAQHSSDISGAFGQIASEILRLAK